jgi:cyclophilin family peptidyl-prolyl cis-trans isomerase
VSTDKRTRQKANRESRVAAAEAAAARDRRRSRLITYAVLAAAIVLAIVGISALTADDDPSDPDTTATAASEAADPAVSTPVTEAPAVTAPEIAAPGVFAPAPGGTIEGDTECPADDGSSERITSFAAAPPMCIDETATYTATVDTSFGAFTIDLNAAAAPDTVNNFVVLARYGYYDGAPFHRIIPGFVIQGGDAVGSPLGTGNPGYAVDDELPQDGAYTIGSVAMANSGPNTNGSQFFVITGEDGAGLPPLYSLFGQVSAGLDVVRDIESAETTVGNAPVESIVINSVTVVQN